MMGDPDTAGRFSDRLIEEGVFAQPVVFPTVAIDKSRLRTIVTAAHAREPVRPKAKGDLVLNVRDIEESHRFWTEVVGFRQVGQLTPTKERPNPPKMRFYSGIREDGTSHHHDVALVENRDLPKPPENWSMFGMPTAINHIAVTMPSREAWLEHVAYLQEKGIKFNRRVDHGMTHSLYIHDPNGYGVEFVYDLKFNETFRYGEVFHQNEQEFSAYNFERADTEIGRKQHQRQDGGRNRAHAPRKGAQRALPCRRRERR